MDKITFTFIMLAGMILAAVGGFMLGQAGVDGEVIVIPVEVCAPSLSIRTLQVGAP